MKQQLTAEIAATRESVWSALTGELALKGGHVDVTLQSAPADLHLVVRPGALERYTLTYALSRLDDAVTAVSATIEPAGPWYVAKRILSFGAVDRGYLDALAVGLANLRVHLEGDEREDEFETAE
jgi:hypothetical protein